jgi:isocitrate dehydrogenase kinase/phosphatase
VKRYFLSHHADFFEPAIWQDSKARLLAGDVPDCLPYDETERFCMRYPERF